MQIKEIFTSVENDGLNQGYLSTYIRTFSCNLDCTYCNEDYCINPKSDDDLVGYTVMDVEEILDIVYANGYNHVCFLGGEPLLQKDAPELVAQLLDEGYKVNIETNGAIDLEPFEEKMVEILADDELLNNLTYTLDYKCPNSGMEGNMITSNINFLIDNDALKFVVDTEADIDYMKSLIEQYEPTAEIFVTARTMDNKDLVNFLKAKGLQRVRVQLPLRKTIYDDDMHE